MLDVRGRKSRTSNSVGRVANRTFSAPRAPFKMSPQQRYTISQINALSPARLHPRRRSSFRTLPVDRGRHRLQTPVRKSRTNAPRLVRNRPHCRCRKTTRAHSSPPRPRRSRRRISRNVDHRSLPAEQASAGLGNLNPAEIAHFQKQNNAYREKFGFPFVICARLNKKEAIIAGFERRLQNDRQQEIKTALEEIFKIADLPSARFNNLTQLWLTV